METSTIIKSRYGVPWLLTEMNNVLFAAVQASWGAVVVAPIMNEFLASLTLEIEIPVLLGFHFNQQMPQVV